MTSHPVA